MEFRSWALFVLLVLAVSRCTDARSPRHRRDADYYVDEDGATPAEHTGVQNDNPEEEAQQDDGDEDGDSEAEYKTPRLLSSALVVNAKPGDTVLLPCDIENQANAVIKWDHGGMGPEPTPLYQASQGRDGKLDKTSKVKLHGNWSIQIPSVTLADAGEYTCELMGLKQNVTHVLRLQPTIVGLWPQDKTLVVEGSELRITCKAEGYPKPTLLWSKVVGQQNTRVTEEQAQFERESIVIRNVTREHAGTYICMAENNIGKPALRDVDIHVVGKPRVHIHRQLENGAIGERAYLHCTVHEQPESLITWYKDGEELVESADVTITLNYPHSDVSIPEVREKDFGNYTCTARNQYGDHSRSVELVEKPVLEDPVVNGEVLEFKVHSHQPLHEVIIAYRRTDKDDAVWQDMAVKPEATAEKHVHLVRFSTGSLQAGEYEAVARARNQYGWSGPTLSAFFPAQQPEPIQAAGVATNPNGAADLRSTGTVLVSTLVTCLLVRLI